MGANRKNCFGIESAEAGRGAMKAREKVKRGKKKKTAQNGSGCGCAVAVGNETPSKR